MLKRAAERYSQLHFIQGDADQFSLNSKFDYVILADLINDLWDVQKAVERVGSVCTPSTRIIINFYSRLWTLPLGMAARLHIANQSLNQNWLTLADLDKMFALSGFEVVRQSQEVLFPPAVPLLAPFCNRYLVKLWPFRRSPT
jgi:Methyltransferase domain